MNSYEYNVLEFVPRSGSSSCLFFAAPPREITKWANAPVKRLRVRIGYQRELVQTRADAITDFLNKDAKNILPSATLIALRPGTYSLTTESGKTTLSITPTELSSAARRELVLAELDQRLNPPAVNSIPATEDADHDPAQEPPIEDPLNPDEALSDVVETVDAPEEEEDSEDSETPPDSYLRQLYQELLGYAGLPTDQKAQVDSVCETLTLPGLIIDGQHRIFGAKEVAESQALRIPVVALQNLPMSEQVFNFYVLNNKAKALDKRELRSIISTSLTKQEINDLYDRFQSSGVNAEEAQWTHRVNTDAASPFRGLISLKLEGEDSPIDDNIMDQVVKDFINLKAAYQTLKVPGWNADADYTFRLSLFYALWSSVKKEYPVAWAMAARGDSSAQMFRKVSLLGIQRYVLETMKIGLRYQPTSPFTDPAECEAQTTASLQGITEAFFLKEWKRKELDTTAGREFFWKSLQKAAENGSARLGNMSLFRSN